MEIFSLASGSSGNCFYAEFGDHAVLVDAGLSAKKITEILYSKGKKPEDIDAILITHEHADHIKGAEVFSRKFKVPVYGTKSTLENRDIPLKQIIKNKETFNFGKLQIETFKKSHQAIDPVFFSITGNKRASFITDLGICCNNANKAVTDSDFLFLESNHDINMLESGKYPYFLKNWVKGPTGHLSNFQASICVIEHASKKLKNLVLSHLSQNNNTPEIAFNTMKDLIKERKDLNVKLTVAPRFISTEIFKI